MINPEIEFKFESVTPETTKSPDAPGSFLARWAPPAELSYFRGHFPGNPVLPAVAMIDATVQLVRQIAGEPRLELSGLKSAKFMHPVTPGLPIEIQLTRIAGDHWKALWKTGSQSVADLSFSASLSVSR